MNKSVFIKNQITRGLKNLDDEDIILISDVDEIPNLQNKKFKSFDSAVFLQKMYFLYNLIENKDYLFQILLFLY